MTTVERIPRDREPGLENSMWQDVRQAVRVLTSGFITRSSSPPSFLAKNAQRFRASARRENGSHAEDRRGRQKAVELHEPTARVEESKIRRSEEDWKRYDPRQAGRHSVLGGLCARLSAVSARD